MADIRELLVRFKGDTSGIERASKQGQKAVGNFEKKTVSASKSMRESLLSLRNVFLGVAAVQFGKSVLDASLQMEKLNALMLSAVGATGDVNGEFERLRDLSNELGLEFSTTAQTFAQFAAAARTSGLEMDIVRDVFDQTAKAGRAMNLTAADMSGVFTALTQIAGKGVVSMEEMRQQLGERVPIAMSAMADGLNMTVAELTDLISSGKLAADVGLRGLADGFRNNADLAASFAESANSTSATINRMRNQLFELKVQLAESGVIDVFTKSISLLGDALVITGKHAENTLRLFQLITDYISRGMLSVLGGLGDGAAWVASQFGLSSQAINDFNKTIDASKVENLKEMSDLLKDVQGKSGTATSVQTTTSSTGALPYIEQTNEALDETVKKTTQLEEAQTNLRDSAKETFDGLVSDIMNGQNALDSLRRVALSVAEDMVKAFSKSFGVGGDSIGGSLGGVLGSIGASVASGFFGGGTPPVPSVKPSFASGGSFVVSGNSGIDRNQLSLNGQPIANVAKGETVAVGRANSGGTTVNQTFNVSTGVQQTVRAEILGLMPQIEKQTVMAVEDARNRGKM